VTTPEKQLAQRIRELRRRHFGARGKAEFAQRLGLAPEEYERFERGTIPPGDVMVRMCDLTGEDLQWLLTGTAARGTVVISGARRRHQNLLTRIAQAIDAEPKLAASLEAFLDLLLAGSRARPAAGRLPAPEAAGLVPVFAPGHWPESLPGPGGDAGGLALARTAELADTPRVSCVLAEPDSEGPGPAVHEAELLAIAEDTRGVERYLHCPGLVGLFPEAFGVRLEEAGPMEPMFAAGDVLVVAPGAEPALGRPALCKFRTDADDRCRIWLGEDDHHVHLGRIADGEHETLPRDELCWALDVLYRVPRAA